MTDGFIAGVCIKYHLHVHVVKTCATVQSSTYMFGGVINLARTHARAHTHKQHTFTQLEKQSKCD